MSNAARDAIATRQVASDSPVRVSTAFDMKGALSWYEAMFVEYVLPPAYLEIHRQISKEIAGHTPRGKMVDVGCGSGSAAIHVARLAPDAVIAGVDLSRRMLAYGDKKLKRLGLDNVSLMYGDATDLPLEDGQFDVAYSIASIKMWPDQQKGLREMHRVLKPGGKLIVLELDRGASAVAVRNYALLFRFIPSAICAAYVRDYVVAQSPDLADAEAMMRKSPFSRFDIQQMPDYPFWVIRSENP